MIKSYGSQNLKNLKPSILNKIKNEQNRNKWKIL